MQGKAEKHLNALRFYLLERPTRKGLLDFKTSQYENQEFPCLDHAMNKQITTVYLEMRQRRQLRRGLLSSDGDVRVIKSREPSPTLNQYFFRTVGLPWQWFSRLEWTHEDWKAYVENPDLHTYIGYLNGTPFGYYELQRHPKENSVEIVFFGLLDEFTGRGLGGYLLTRATTHAWELECSRVCLHTCTLDHPNALTNYESRGFVEYKRETKVEEIPNKNDPAWLTPDFMESYRRFTRK